MSPAHTLRTRLKFYLLVLLLGSGVTAVSGCDLILPHFSDPEGPGCSNTCEYAFDGACDDGGPGSEFSVCAYGTDCGDCGTRDDGADVDEAPGGCDSSDYDSGYGTGDEQVDLMCQAAWGYRCAGMDTEADVTCTQIREFVGNTTGCPYCD